jgi:hypothetical protein
MMGNNDIELFFNRTFESQINDRMFFYSYVFEKEKVIDYVQRIDGIPFSCYLSFVTKFGFHGSVSSADIIQFSSFDDCTKVICKRLFTSGDKGLNYDQVGALLLDDGKERKKGAIKKYGENHCKASCLLGLTQCKERYYFLSCLGQVFNELSDGEKGLLISRLCLRDRFIQKIIFTANNSAVDLNTEMGILSHSTITRRRSNVCKLLGIVYEYANPSFAGLFNNIFVNGSHLF